MLLCFAFSPGALSAPFKIQMTFQTLISADFASNLRRFCRQRFGLRPRRHRRMIFCVKPSRKGLKSKKPVDLCRNAILVIRPWTDFADLL